MVSHEHRMKALEVASGCPYVHPDERGLQKAVTYGLVVKALAQLTLPTPDELLVGRAPGCVNLVTNLLAKDLKSRCDNLLEGDADLRGELDEAASRRSSIVHKRAMTDGARETLHSGVNTAMHIEGITLGTIQSRLQSGREITQNGLDKSQRVPFAFAMQSLEDLDLNNKHLFSWEWLADAGDFDSETWSQVLRPDVTEMTPDFGLILTTSLPPHEGYSAFAGEPAIGCPVTMIKNFVRDLHIVSSEVCVQSGLISVV